VLSTGKVETTACNFNSRTGTSTAVEGGLDGDPDLEAIVPAQMLYDTVVLEFDATFNRSGWLTASYVFGSDEYNEWVGSAFGDVMAIFVQSLSDEYDQTATNVALLPNTNLPVRTCACVAYGKSEQKCRNKQRSRCNMQGPGGCIDARNSRRRRPRGCEPVEPPSLPPAARGIGARDDDARKVWLLEMPVSQMEHKRASGQGCEWDTANENPSHERQRRVRYGIRSSSNSSGQQRSPQLRNPGKTLDGDRQQTRMMQVHTSIARPYGCTVRLYIPG
jgi:hypothetical protein